METWADDVVIEALNAITFELVSGEGDTDNGSFTIDGGTLKSKTSFDFEEKKHLPDTGQGSSSGGLEAEKIFTIEVQDIVGNQPPTDILLDNDTIAENEPVGTVVGKLSLVDEDMYPIYAIKLSTPEASISLEKSGFGGKGAWTFEFWLKIHDSFPVIPEGHHGHIFVQNEDFSSYAMRPMFRANSGGFSGYYHRYGVNFHNYVTADSFERAGII